MGVAGGCMLVRVLIDRRNGAASLVVHGMRRLESYRHDM